MVQYSETIENFHTLQPDTSSVIQWSNIIDLPAATTTHLALVHSHSWLEKLHGYSVKDET